MHRSQHASLIERLHLVVRARLTRVDDNDIAPLDYSECPARIGRCAHDIGDMSWEGRFEAHEDLNEESLCDVESRGDKDVLISQLEPVMTACDEACGDKCCGDKR